MDSMTWEEKYLRLRDDHTSLTHKANEQDDTIRRWEDFLVLVRVQQWEDAVMNEAKLACERTVISLSIRVGCCTPDISSHLLGNALQCMV